MSQTVDPRRAAEIMGASFVSPAEYADAFRIESAPEADVVLGRVPWGEAVLVEEAERGGILFPHVFRHSMRRLVDGGADGRARLNVPTDAWGRRGLYNEHNQAGTLPTGWRLVRARLVPVPWGDWSAQERLIPPTHARSLRLETAEMAVLLAARGGTNPFADAVAWCADVVPCGCRALVGPFGDNGLDIRFGRNRHEHEKAGGLLLSRRPGL